MQIEGKESKERVEHRWVHMLTCLSQALREHRRVQQTDDIDGRGGGGAEAPYRAASASPLEHGPGTRSGKDGPKN